MNYGLHPGFLDEARTRLTSATLFIYLRRRHRSHHLTALLPNHLTDLRFYHTGGPPSSFTGESPSRRDVDKTHCGLLNILLYGEEIVAS